MTLPSSGSISTAQILAELRSATPSRNYPLRTTDADVMALAGKSAPPVIIPADFYGKSAVPPTAPLDAYADSYPSESFDSTQVTEANLYPSMRAEGGQTPYTYQWSFTSNPGGFTLTNATQAYCRLRRTFLSGSTGYASAVLQCVVRDKQGSQVTVSGVQADADWYNGNA